MQKIIIIGGVAGGASAAARLRRLSEDTEIILVERGEYISFANCGLPYHISGVIKDKSSLIVETVEGMSENFNLDIRNLSEVTKINREEKKVQIKNIRTKEVYFESYDKLIISTGAKPLFPNIKGLDRSKNVFTLRNIPDLENIIKYIGTNNVRKSTVIGGGFIGLEVMENLKLRGLDVTLVEQSNQVMQNFDYELSQLLHKKIASNGINLILNDGVTEFIEEGYKIKLNSGKVIESDLTILSIGVSPDNNLAKVSNIVLTKKGYIKVDKNFLTNDKDIYAIGDVVEINNLITKENMPIALAGPANKQGRFVANHINGFKDNYKGSLGTSVTKIFDLVVGSTGLNEKQLKLHNLEFESIVIHPNNHASYYPGAKPVTLKVLYNKDSLEIYGAQAIGYEGVDKRIDVIATAMQANLNIVDLKDLELSYAPPFSNAKDPVNMVGFVASNIIENLIEFVSLEKFREDYLNNNSIVFLDVRGKAEYRLSKLPNSINIPLDELRNNLNKLDKSKTYYVYCQVGQRSYYAARVLLLNGFKVKGLKGGLKAYNCLFNKEGDEVCFSNQSDSGVWTF